jgi:DNA-binding response OmpR family regulator
VCDLRAASWNAVIPGMHRVLVVEDDPDLRANLVELLSSEGFNVCEAETGDEALAKISEGGLDLVVTDVVMPGPFGVQVAAMAHTAGEAVPMIVITALREPWVDEHVSRLPRAELLYKPFSAEELLERVHRVLPAISVQPSA